MTNSRLKTVYTDEPCHLAIDIKVGRSNRPKLHLFSAELLLHDRDRSSVAGIADNVEGAASFTI